MITIIDINNLFNIIKKSLAETPPYVWTHWCPLYLFNSLVRALFGHKTSSARFGCCLGQLCTVTISNKYIIFSRINNTLHNSDILIIHIEIKDMVFTIKKQTIMKIMTDLISFIKQLQAIKLSKKVQILHKVEGKRFQGMLLPQYTP